MQITGTKSKFLANENTST